MPAMTSIQTHPYRASFYGRSRTSSNDSIDSHRSSTSNSSQSTRQRRGANHSAIFSSSTSSSATTSQSVSSINSASSLHHSKQQISATTDAPHSASKRAHTRSSAVVSSSSSSSIHIHIEGLKEETRQRSSLLDEPNYQSETIEHMHHMETETTACIDLMDAQPELRWFMRPYLVDFIVEIHQTFRLRPETLYLTMNIVDRYVSKRIVYKRHFQLVGCAALLIAAKFEDSKDKVPTVSELSQMCCSAYDESAFTQMEGHVLSTIGWVLGFPTPEAWLRITSLQKGMDLKIQSVARFLMEVTLFHRDFIGLLPSQLAAGALMLARFVCGKANKPSPEDTEETIAAAQSIDSHMMENASELSEILVKKYNYSHFAYASKLVKDWYARSTQAQKSATATGLLPAQSVSIPHLAAHNDEAKEVTPHHQHGTLSTTTPPRGNQEREEEEEDVSMESRCTSPSSMISTPSRMSGGEDDELEEEDDDDDEEGEIEEEEDHDMPVTPLSLNANHDPLLSTSHSSQSVDSTTHKENAKLVHPTNTKSQNNFLQVTSNRPTLCLNQQGNNIGLA